MLAQRFGQCLIIVVFGLATLGALTWLVLVNHGPRWWLVLSVVLVLSLPVWITLLYIRHDLLAEQGRGLAEMRAAGYVQVEEEDDPVNILGVLEIPRWHKYWEWIDYDEDGEVDPGELVPRRTYINRACEIPAPPKTPAQKARDLLSWCYDRAEKNLGYGQNDRGAGWKRADYDAAMRDLKHIGLIDGGGTQGNQWQLVIVPPTGGDWSRCRRAALAVFENNVVEE